MSRFRRDHLCHFVGLGHIQPHALSGRIGSTDDHSRLAAVVGDPIGTVAAAAAWVLETEKREAAE